MENFRDAPNGTKLGTLLAGTEIESIGEEGQWVRFRVEGWVWGPSLEGYVSEEEDRDGTKEEPIPPLQDERPRIKEADQRPLWSDFTGWGWTRISVGCGCGSAAATSSVRLGSGAPLPCSAVRPSCCRAASILTKSALKPTGPTAAGEVGQYIAATAATDLARAGDDWAAWRQHTRFSIDGGETWEEAE